MKTLYTAEALATGEGRDGHGRTSDGTLDLDLAIPKEMGGSGNGTNPEQLFADRLRRVLPLGAAAGRPPGEGRRLGFGSGRAGFARPDRRRRLRPRGGTRDHAAQPRPRRGAGSWPRRRTRCARTRTPPAATSTSSWSSPTTERAQPSSCGERADPGDEPVEERLGVDLDADVRVGLLDPSAAPVGHGHAAGQRAGQFDVDRRPAGSAPDRGPAPPLRPAGRAGGPGSPRPGRSGTRSRTASRPRAPGSADWTPPTGCRGRRARSSASWPNSAAAASRLKIAGVIATFSVRLSPNTIGRCVGRSSPHAALHTANTSAADSGSTLTFHSATGVVLPR